MNLHFILDRNRKLPDNYYPTMRQKQTPEKPKRQIHVPVELETYQFFADEAWRQRRTIAGLVRIHLEDIAAAAKNGTLDISTQ